MSGEKEDWSELFDCSEFSDWWSSVDSPTDGLLGDLFSDANINPCSPIGPFTSLHQHQPPSSPKCNLSDITTTISLPTSTCLSLLAKLITDRSDLESESVELQKLGDEAQLVCLKLSITKKVLLDLAKCPSGKLKLLLQEAETLKPIPGFMIEETMTNSLRFLIESTAQYALSQISATVENLHHSALTTSLQPLALDLHNNELHRCKIASLIYMFSLDCGMGVDCGHHSHAFLLKLPFWNPNVQFYYCKEPLMLNHDQYYNVRGTLALPVFETSRQSCVGVLELIMTSQKISYAPEHVRVTKPSTNEKLDLRLDCFQILQTTRSPLQPQARQNGGPIENGSNVISACQSHNAVVLSEIEDTGESSKIKSGKKEESIGLEILQQHFHLTLLDAASRLNVSRSTLKRICRKLGISEWPSHKRNKLKPVDESVPSAGANDPNLSTSPSLLPTVVVLDQPKPPGSELQKEKGQITLL
ncbi:Protein NLP7 [Camellia lanceoleosa]|uniref:Protein NLP7 n=1 Tax=Camellia lanceoleosa TaxID=1840588 RepID=A0ACC0H0F2_9ERIC|nr:Protein NLP7 [Camellia lanceoleosa]